MVLSVHTDACSIQSPQQPVSNMFKIPLFLVLLHSSGST